MGLSIQAGTKTIPVDLNTAPLMRPVSGGTAAKSLVVLHETVSPDYAGLADILGVARYMPTQGYGIHGIIDADGNLGWALGMRDAILAHAASNGGGVNTRGIGIELISRVMLDKPDNLSRFQWWSNRDAQIDKLAKVLAFISRADGVPLRYSAGYDPGITTHWDVSHTFNVSGGHTDCFPRHKGGYFPVLRIIERARQFRAKGY
jgi:hypothetical protein